MKESTRRKWKISKRKLVRVMSDRKHEFYSTRTIVRREFDSQYLPEIKYEARSQGKQYSQPPEVIGAAVVGKGESLRDRSSFLQLLHQLKAYSHNWIINEDKLTDEEVQILEDVTNKDAEDQ